MCKIKDTIIEKQGLDLSWEHEQHNLLIPDKCYKCYEEDADLTHDKRVEEAEQADASFMEEWLGQDDETGKDETYDR